MLKASREGPAVQKDRRMLWKSRRKWMVGMRCRGPQSHCLGGSSLVCMVMSGTKDGRHEHQP